jgi:prevent-host-death family protein
MSVITIHEAKAKLSELIDRTLRGEEVIIAKRNKPLIRLVPVAAGPSKRRLGTAKGRVLMHEDFDSLPAGFDQYVP